MNTKLQKTEGPTLGNCLMMDAMGMASYLIPGIGEVVDFIWALIAGVIFYKWFHTAIGATGSIAEEVLPFTDIIPSFTLGYFFINREDD